MYQNKNSEYTVRKATLADMPSLVHLMSMWLSESKKLQQDDYDRLTLLAAKILGDPGTFVAVATIKKKGIDKCVGMGVGCIEYNPFFGRYEGKGQMIYVSPKYRGYTVANQLLALGEEWVKSVGKGITVMKISTVVPKLFIRAGWEPERETLMKKKVA